MNPIYHKLMKTSTLLLLILPLIIFLIGELLLSFPRNVPRKMRLFIMLTFLPFSLLMFGMESFFIFPRLPDFQNPEPLRSYADKVEASADKTNILEMDMVKKLRSTVNSLDYQYQVYAEMKNAAQNLMEMPLWLGAMQLLCVVQWYREDKKKNMQLKSSSA